MDRKLTHLSPERKSPDPYYIPDVQQLLKDRIVEDLILGGTEVIPNSANRNRS